MLESIELSNEVSKEIRTLSYLLHPPLLDELGLSSAVEWFAQGFESRTGIRVDVDIPASFDRLAPDAEVALFRIVQESLANVHRYSGSADRLRSSTLQRRGGPAGDWRFRQRHRHGTTQGRSFFPRAPGSRNSRDEGTRAPAFRQPWRSARGRATGPWLQRSFRSASRAEISGDVRESGVHELEPVVSEQAAEGAMVGPSAS